jgi:putative membrane protein
MPGVGPIEFLVTMAITVFWVVVVTVPVVLVLRAVRNAFRRPDPAIDALRTRFANGDIDEAEYERLRRTLQRG